MATVALLGSSGAIAVAASAGPQVVLSVNADDPTQPSVAHAVATPFTGSTPITDYSFDFGDGTVVDGTTGTVNHPYADAGSHTVTLTATDNTGMTIRVAKVVAVGYSYTPMSPQRLLDTRIGLGAAGGQVGPNGTVSFQVAGVANVPPSGLTDVVLNVTATGATQGTYLTAYPGNTVRPTTSNLNVPAGGTVPNVVTVPVGQNGMVTVYNHSGSVDVIADIEGYYSFGDGASTTGFTRGFVLPNEITRVLDTRTGMSTPQAKLGAGGILSTVVPGSLPGDSLILNVTVTNATAGSYLTVWPDGSPRPTASNVNIAPGAVESNLVIVPIGADEKVDFYNNSGSVDVVVDEEGVVEPGVSSVSEPFVPTAPTRIVDTRDGTGVPAGPVSGGQLLRVPVPQPGIAAGVVLNLTITDVTANTYLTIGPDSQLVPFGADINAAPGQTVSVQVVTASSAVGFIYLYNHTGTVDAVIDVSGYYLNNTL